MIPELEKRDEHWSWRQVGAVSATGEVFSHTGADAWDHASHIEGEGSLALGNYMDSPEPVKTMAAALEEGRDLPMDERLMRAIEAGRAAGGQGSSSLDLFPRRGRLSRSSTASSRGRPSIFGLISTSTRCPSCAAC